MPIPQEVKPQGMLAKPLPPTQEVEEENPIFNLLGAKNAPKMKADLNQFVSKGMQLLHSEDTRDQVVSVLRSSSNPAQGVSDALVPIVQRIDSASRAAGQEVHDAVKLLGAIELVGQIIEIGELSKALPKMSDEDKNTALAVSIQDYMKGEIDAGRVDPKVLQQQLSQGMNQLSEDQKIQIGDSMKSIHETAMSYNDSSDNATGGGKQNGKPGLIG